MQKYTWKHTANTNFMQMLHPIATLHEGLVWRGMMMKLTSDTYLRLLHQLGQNPLWDADNSVTIIVEQRPLISLSLSNSTSELCQLKTLCLPLKSECIAMSSLHTHPKPSFLFLSNQTTPAESYETCKPPPPKIQTHTHLPRDTMTPPILPPANTHKPETHKQLPPPPLQSSGLLIFSTHRHKCTYSTQMCANTNKLVLTCSNTQCIQWANVTTYTEGN